MPVLFQNVRYNGVKSGLYGMTKITNGRVRDSVVDGLLLSNYD